VTTARSPSADSQPPRTWCGDLANPPRALVPLLEQRHWLIWSWQRGKNRKWTKPPRQAKPPHDLARNNDPTTWSSHGDALAALRAGKAAGLGFALTGTVIAALDLDHCRDPETGALAGWAVDLIDEADSYVEITPSGAGVRIIGTTTDNAGKVHRKFSVADAADGAAIEVYRHATRYITVTGLRMEESATELRNIDHVIDAVVARYDRIKDGGSQDIADALDLEHIIKHGVPTGQRSEAFSKVVWSLAARGLTVDEIEARLEKHPNGIAAKYYPDRFRAEIERCYKKWQAQQPCRPPLVEPSFELKKGGLPKTNCHNARIAISRLGIDCRYDVFHDKLLVGGHVIAQQAGELSDHACLVLRQLIERFGFDPGRNHIFDASVQLCLQNQFDPVVDYLNALEWDGVPRLETWLHVYLGAEDTQLHRTIGRLTLIAMVRRARRPGCKFDQIIVLEGKEGTLKSSALAVLAGTPENFSDQTLLGLKDREQQEQLRGRWVFEISDLSGIRHAEVEHVKAFASRSHDRARPAYGRTLIEMPRRCVIFGTTNDDTYLKSRTGNRRFWPIKTGTIDLDLLIRDRDQLFAEAVTLEAQGAPLELPRELWDEARGAQDERLEHDPWTEKLRSVIGTPFDTDDGGKEYRISTDELLTAELEIPVDRQTTATAKRLANVMRELGWQGPKLMRFGPGRAVQPERGYFKPTPADPAAMTLAEVQAELLEPVGDPDYKQALWKRLDALLE
jgi:hypothetical protein